MFPGKNHVSNFPNIPKKGNRYSGRGSTKGSKVDEPTSRHITKMAKVKERILKAAREKVSYKGTPLRLPADFSAEVLSVSYHSLAYKVPKGKNLQPRTLFRRIII